jgi:methylmalonyl-CoA/ethylmalonyl-CoA epimerase
MNYPLDHIGIATQNLDEAVANYHRDFGFELNLRETVPSQNVEVAFLSLPNTLIELLAPTSAQCNLQKFLDTHGPGLHHICYRVGDIRAELARLKGLGHRLIDETPRPGAHKSQIAFLHPKTMGGVLIELCQR